MLGEEKEGEGAEWVSFWRDGAGEGGELSLAPRGKTPSCPFQLLVAPAIFGIPWPMVISLCLCFHHIGPSLVCVCLFFW